MSDLFDYLAWRGDLSFESVPPGPVDHVILTRLAYMPYEGIVPSGFGRPVPLAAAARGVLARVARQGVHILRLRDDERLLRAVCGAPRYADLGVCGFCSVFDDRAQEQFCAVTFLLPGGTVYLSYRGTDGTLVGWKEDFNMGFSETVPAQQDAVRYARGAAGAFDGPLMLSGHSKGGNLAVYAAAFSGGGVGERITLVRSLDGPGFCSRVLADERYRAVLPRVQTLLPQSSVIGMLLEHAEPMRIVRSSAVGGLLQHNLYTWQVRRGELEAAEGLTGRSRFADAALTGWLAGMEPAMREKLADGVFRVLSSSEGRTLRELWNGRNALEILRAVNGLDDETRALLAQALHILGGSLRGAMPQLLSGLEAFVPGGRIKNE